MTNNKRKNDDKENNIQKKKYNRIIIDPESSESSDDDDKVNENSDKDDDNKVNENIDPLTLLFIIVDNNLDNNENKTFSPHTPDYPPPDYYGEHYNEECCDGKDDEHCDDDDFYEDDFNIFLEDPRELEEKKDNEKNEKKDTDRYNFRNNKNNRKQDNPKKTDSEQIDFFFKNLLNGSLKNKRDGTFDKESSYNKKRRMYDDFKDYFNESDILLPINKSIKTLKDLIELGETYDQNDKNRYVINLRALNKCVIPLKELDNMIGMKNIKEMIIDLIFFRLQNLGDSQNELWHLVIQGSPGSGKTEVSKIIGKLYYGLGITKKDKFTLVKRSDLIGKYLGHTAKMTQDVFDDARGGILFIDEAYSLGNPEGRDSFSKECIDTINQNLTENRETVVFIAGYKEQLDESFFSYNPGLNRRFKMRMNVDKYNAGELREIFLKKLNENNWSVLNNDFTKEIPISFFEKNMNLFKYNGGDMENLWHFTKIVHARRIFGQSNEVVKKITYKDLENSLKMYNENDEFKNRDGDVISKYLLDTMYC